MSDTLPEVLGVAAARFEDSLRRALPGTAPRLFQYLKRVPVPGLMVETCLSVRSFPAFSLPYWLTPEEERHHDFAFQCDVAYSTLNGYFFVRLLDNVMDGDGPPELPRLLPAAGYFFAEFGRPYQNYFPPEDRFWDTFRASWNEQADCTSMDAFLDDIQLEDYRAVCARKFGASKGPLAAAAARYGRWGDFAEWSEFVDELGAFSQMVNDLFDWHHDYEHGINTYLLCEYQRRRAPGEQVASWFVREGFAWGESTLWAWLDALGERAVRLGSPEARRWVEERKILLESELKTGRAGLSVLRALKGGA